MTKTIAFDVYGTLIDTNGVVKKLTETIGELAPAFANTWREKQLEYSFRRGLMKNYQQFDVCTKQALDYCCLFYKVKISHTQKESLLDVYKTLPCFSDVVDVLKDLTESGHQLYAFSNGSASAVKGLLEAADISEYFLDVISVDSLKTFKPDPAVYQYLLQETNTKNTESWLISSNSFDVIGAINCDMKAAWVQRSNSHIFDPWGIEPTITINSLDKLHKGITELLDN